MEWQSLHALAGIQFIIEADHLAHSAAEPPCRTTRRFSASARRSNSPTLPVDQIPATVAAELSRLKLADAREAGPDRGDHRRQPRHRQHRPHHQGGRRALSVARRQAVHRAGDGQPRRRHGRRAARAARRLRHHRGVLRLPDPREHGDGRSSARRPRAFPSTSTSTPSRPITCWSSAASSRTPASSATSKPA